MYGISVVLDVGFIENLERRREKKTNGSEGRESEGMMMMMMTMMKRGVVGIISWEQRPRRGGERNDVSKRVTVG